MGHTLCQMAVYICHQVERATRVIDSSSLRTILETLWLVLIDQAHFFLMV